MAAPSTYPYSNSYKVGKGRLAFNALVDGIYQGFKWLGNCPGFTISVESENLTHTSSEGGLSETDLDVPISITRTATINVDNLNASNQAIFLSATAGTLTQTSATVTGEAVTAIRAERMYQLGTAATPSGARSITGVTVEVDATARANSTPYTVGQIYEPATPNNHIYLCTVLGTSAASPPTFTTDGTDFADGTATFIDLGVVTGLTAATDYIVDGALGLLSIPATGKLASAYAAALDAIPTSAFSINLSVDYTRPANTRSQVATGSVAAVDGQLKFVADNPIGENQDVFFPSCTLRPSGELPFITEGEVAAVEFAVGINKLDSVTAAIYLDGRPV